MRPPKKRNMTSMKKQKPQKGLGYCVGLATAGMRLVDGAIWLRKGVVHLQLRPEEVSKPSEGSAAGAEASSEVATLKVPCAPVECDFSNGPCSYQNDYYSEWQLREIEGGKSSPI